MLASKQGFHAAWWGNAARDCITIRPMQPPYSVSPRGISHGTIRCGCNCGTATGKTGGVYIPPFKLARMMAEQAQQDRASPEFQRLTWEALKKSLNGIINKVNTVNIKNILPEVFREVGAGAGAGALADIICGRV